MAFKFNRPAVDSGESSVAAFLALLSEEEREKVVKLYELNNVSKDIAKCLWFHINTCSVHSNVQRKHPSKSLRDHWVICSYRTPLPHLQFAPRWIIKTVIDEEMKAYQSQNTFKECDIRSLPKHENIFSLYSFFQTNKDGDDNKLKLKLRLVSHGNRDNGKSSI